MVERCLDSILLVITGAGTDLADCRIIIGDRESRNTDRGKGVGDDGWYQISSFCPRYG
jgi:hypothetical protein